MQIFIFGISANVDPFGTNSNFFEGGLGTETVDITYCWF